MEKKDHLLCWRQTGKSNDWEGKGKYDWEGGKVFTKDQNMGSCIFPLQCFVWEPPVWSKLLLHEGVLVFCKGNITEIPFAFLSYAPVQRNCVNLPESWNSGPFKVLQLNECSAKGSTWEISGPLLSEKEESVTQPLTFASTDLFITLCLSW